MSDLADLPVRPREPAPRRRVGRGVALAVFLVLLLVLVGGLFLGGRAVVHALGRPTIADYPGAGTGEVLVQVKTGQTASDIGTTLQGQDVVKSAAAFSRAATAETRSRTVQPGYYRLHQKMSGAAAVALLLDPASRALSRVTVPEGVTVAETVQKIADSTEIPLADLQAAVKDPSGLGLPAYAGGQLEGFLYPATYDIEPGTSAVDALRTMTARYVQAADALSLQDRARAIGQTPYAVVIAASLIEKETAFPDDRAKVAQIVYNRLAAGMPLQFDSTVNYLRAEKKARLSLDDIKQESAYNTYLNKGLPPTPIDSPGQAALEAALNPAGGDAIYFVTTSKDGSSLFTADYGAFLAAKAKAQADGVY